jgi:hypothetical protein
MPAYTNVGNFRALMKIPTNSGLGFVNTKTADNGWIKVRFLYNDVINVERTFWTGSAWGIACMHWCCTSAPLTGVSRILDQPDKYKCQDDFSGGCNSCSCFFWFDKKAPADVTRSRMGRVVGYK